MKIFTGIIFLLLTLQLQATEESKTLKQNMREMNTHLRAISRTVSDPAKNADNAKECDTLIGLMTTAKEQQAPFILTLPPEQQEGAFAEYKRMIQMTIDAFKKMQQFFQLNDNAGAENMLKELQALKKDGHDTFDP